MRQVMTTPTQKMTLSCEPRFSMSLMTVLVKPKVFITSKTFFRADFNVPC